MSVETPLARLKSLLNAVHLPAYLMARSPEIPFEQLLVSLDPADPTAETQIDSTYVMQLFFTEDILRSAPPLDPDAGVPAAHQIDSTTLQFYMDLPMALNPERILDTYRLLAALSKILPYGALYVNEAGDTPGIFFSYALAAESPNISALLIIEILETLQFFLSLFAPRIEGFQFGSQDLMQTLQATEADWEQVLAGLSA